MTAGRKGIESVRVAGSNSFSLLFRRRFDSRAISKEGKKFIELTLLLPCELYSIKREEKIEQQINFSKYRK